MPANDVSSTAESLLKLAAVGESEAGVEGHVIQQRRGSVSMNHTATRTTTPSAMSRSFTDMKSVIDEPAVQHKVTAWDSFACLSVSMSVCLYLCFLFTLLL